jgi:hypothetical protein
MVTVWATVKEGNENKSNPIVYFIHLLFRVLFAKESSGA